ncbi:hypothetical protein P8452_56095 [Trifolium repens]|nr:hypothetical protein P8452_56095 [Trifolium repens]
MHRSILSIAPLCSFGYCGGIASSRGAAPGKRKENPKRKKEKRETCAKFYNDVVLQFVGVKFGQILSVLSLTLFQTLVELAAVVVHYSFSCVLSSRSPTSHPSIVVGLKCPREERYTGADGFGFSIKGNVLGFKNLQFSIAFSRSVRWSMVEVAGEKGCRESHKIYLTIHTSSLMTNTMSLSLLQRGKLLPLNFRRCICCKLEELKKA